MRKVAIEAGCAYTKVAAFDNNNQLIESCIPSILVRGKSATDMAGNKAPSYWCNGQQWSVLTESPKNEPTDLDDYPYTDQNTVLMHHALRMAGINNDEIELATCIPMEQYYSDMDGNIARKKQSVSQTVTDINGNSLTSFNHKITIPECVSGWVDMCYRIGGEMNPNVPNGQVGLVDVGGRTTDLVIVQGKQVMDDTISTLPHGYLGIFKNLNELINQRYSDTGKFAINVLDNALNKKRIEIETGKVVDISDLVEQSINNFSRQLMNDVNRILGGQQQLSGTCFFGGGVENESMRKIILEQPKTMIPKKPQYSNSRGALKAFWLKD